MMGPCSFCGNDRCYGDCSQWRSAKRASEGPKVRRARPGEPVPCSGGCGTMLDRDDAHSVEIVTDEPHTNLTCHVLVLAQKLAAEARAASLSKALTDLATTCDRMLGPDAWTKQGLALIESLRAAHAVLDAKAPPALNAPALESTVPAPFVATSTHCYRCNGTIQSIPCLPECVPGCEIFHHDHVCP